MKPASPVIPGHEEVVYAKDQPEYNPLPSIKQPDGCVVTRWEMTWRERFKAFFVGSVYLEVLTFNQPLQPLKMSIDVPDVQTDGGQYVTPKQSRTKFIPWVTGILFKFGFQGLSWRLADWYIDRISAKASQAN